MIFLSFRTNFRSSFSSHRCPPLGRVQAICQSPIQSSNAFIVCFLRLDSVVYLPLNQSFYRFYQVFIVVCHRVAVKFSQDKANGMALVILNIVVFLIYCLLYQNDFCKFPDMLFNDREILSSYSMVQQYIHFAYISLSLYSLLLPFALLADWSFSFVNSKEN